MYSSCSLFTWVHCVFKSPLVYLIPLGVPFPFASNGSTYPEKLSAYKCGSDPSGDARSRFDIRFYPVPILFIIPFMVRLPKLDFLWLLD